MVYLKQGAPIHDLSGNRFFIWNMALKAWLEHPWLGVGFGKLLQGEVPNQWAGGMVYLEQIYIHSLPVNLLLMIGVVGFTAVAILLLAWFHKVRKTCRKIGDGERATYQGIVVFCLIILVMSCYGETLRYSPPGYLFWAALGIEAAFAWHANKQSNFEAGNAK
jgi:O-antigen ligase